MARIFLITLFIGTLVFPAYPGSLDIGTRVSYYIPPEDGASSTLMLGVDAYYMIGRYFSGRLSIENANYAVDGIQYSLTPITLSLIGHPYPNAPVDPYVGFGIGYYDKKIDGVSNSTTGMHAMAGINARISNIVAGLELRYTIPDIDDGHVNYTSFSGNMTGGLRASF